MEELLGSRLLVRKMKAEVKTKSGIYMAPKSEEMSYDIIKGEVIKRGKESKDDPLTSVVGEEVFFRELDGDKIIINGEQLLVINQGSVIGRN